jgi:CheY-like chemotaxis protein
MSEMEKILVVDDERLNINVLVELLRPDYKIMAAINGMQALKAARSASPPGLSHDAGDGWLCCLPLAEG